MKVNHLFYMAGLLATMASCTGDEIESGSTAGRVPVTLTYTTLQAAETRAAANATLNESNIESGKEVRVRIANYNTGEYSPYNYTTGEAGALNLPSPAPYYPLDGTHIDILAYYPASAGTSFSVQTDQTSDDNYTASDLMWATPKTNLEKTTGAQALSFTHKMVKIKVTAAAGTAVSKINAITLKNAKPTVTFNQSTGAIGEASGDAGDIKMAKSESATSVTGVALFPPQTIDGQLIAVDVTMSNSATGTAYYSVDDKTFEGGNVYTLNLTVNQPEVGATTAINAWNDGGTTYNLSIDNISAQTYNGSPLTPPVTVKNAAGTTLTANTHYTVAYANNVNAGTATVNVYGKGDYVGCAATKTFTINKNTPTITLSRTSGSCVKDGRGYFTATVTGYSGTLSVTSGTTSVATVSSSPASDGTVTITGVAAGSSTITVSAAGNSNSNAASKTFTATVLDDIKLNPLYFVSEYNVAQSGTAFETTLNAGYYFNWADAMSKFAKTTTSYTVYTTAGKTIGDVEWHLPVQGEWWSVMPGNNTGIWGFDSGSGTLKSSYITPIWGSDATTKAGVSETSYWKKVNAKEIHAIRFLGTKYCSVWKYELLGGFDQYSYGMLRISSTLIGDHVGTTAALAKSWYDSHWKDVTFSDSYAVQRTFYARGYVNGASGATATGEVGTYGHFWSATENSSNTSYAWLLHFASGYAYVRNNTKSYGRSVRLFRDN